MKVYFGRNPMRNKFLIAASLLAASVTAAPAATLFAVDGPDGPGSPAIGPFVTDDGAAQTFTLANSLTNVSFGFDLFCLSTCGGSLQLISGDMSLSASVGQFVTEVAFSGVAGANAALSGLSLAAGQYTLIMSMTAGAGIWYSTDAPVFTGSGVGVANEFKVLGSLDPNYLARSPTTTVVGEMLKFSIDGTVSGGGPVGYVPLPASAPLMLAAIAVIGGLARRRRR